MLAVIFAAVPRPSCNSNGNCARRNSTGFDPHAEAGGETKRMMAKVQFRTTLSQVFITSAQHMLYGNRRLTTIGSTPASPFEASLTMKETRDYLVNFFLRTREATFVTLFLSRRIFSYSIQVTSYADT